MLHDTQLEMNEIVGVHPVLRGLTYKRALASSGTGVTLDWVTSGANKIIQFRQLNDKAVPVIFVEWTLLEVILNECGFKWAASLFIMFLGKGMSFVGMRAMTSYYQPSGFS